MQITEESYNKLLKFARQKYRKYKLDWLDPRDILHEFLVSPEYDDKKEERFIFLDFRNFIVDDIRFRTSKKHQRTRTYTFSDFRRSPHRIIDEDAEEERLDLWFYKHSATLREGYEPGCYIGEGGYRNPFTGEINYDLMLRDMLIVMLRYDKYLKWHIYNSICWELQPRILLDFMDWFHHLDLDDKKLVFGLMLSKMSGETQQEIADRIGISQSSVSRLQKQLFSQLKKSIKNYLKVA